MKFEDIEYEGIIERNIKIFQYLAHKYKGSFRNYDMEDLIHIQVLACYKVLDKYNQEHKIGTFLFTVAENKLKALYRSERRGKRMPEAIYYLETTKLEESGWVLNDKDDDAETKYYISEVKANADQIAKDVLSDFEYNLYKKTVYEHKTNSQLAIELGKSEKQINNGISRMRRKMREKRDSISSDM